MNGTRCAMPACLYSERAGDRAVARSAYAEAVAHFVEALAQASRLPQGKDRDRRELAVLLKQGPAVLIYKGSGSLEGSRPTFRRRGVVHPFNSCCG